MPSLKNLMSELLWGCLYNWNVELVYNVNVLFPCHLNVTFWSCENKNQGDCSNFDLHSVFSPHHAMNYSENRVFHCMKLISLDLSMKSSLQSCQQNAICSGQGMHFVDYVGLFLLLFICIVHTPDFHLVSFWSHTWSCWFGCWSHLSQEWMFAPKINLHLHPTSSLFKNVPPNNEI